MSDHDVPPDDQREGGETSWLPWRLLARQAVGECYRARAEQRRRFGRDDRDIPFDLVDEAVHRINDKLAEKILEESENTRLTAFNDITGQLLKTIMELAPPGSETWIREDRFPPVE